MRHSQKGSRSVKAHRFRGVAPVETSLDNRAHQYVGAETARRDPLKEDCPFVPARSSCIHHIKYRAYPPLCQVFILSHLLFLWYYLVHYFYETKIYFL